MKISSSGYSRQGFLRKRRISSKLLAFILAFSMIFVFAPGIFFDNDNMSGLFGSKTYAAEEKEFGDGSFFLSAEYEKPDGGKIGAMSQGADFHTIFAFRPKNQATFLTYLETQLSKPADEQDVITINILKNAMSSSTITSFDNPEIKEDLRLFTDLDGNSKTFLSIDNLTGDCFTYKAKLNFEGLRNYMVNEVGVIKSVKFKTDMKFSDSLAEFAWLVQIVEGETAIELNVPKSEAATEVKDTVTPITGEEPDATTEDPSISAMSEEMGALDATLTDPLVNGGLPITITNQDFLIFDANNPDDTVLLDDNKLIIESSQQRYGIYFEWEPNRTDPAYSASDKSYFTIPLTFNTNPPAGVYFTNIFPDPNEETPFDVYNETGSDVIAELYIKHRDSNRVDMEKPIVGERVWDGEYGELSGVNNTGNDYVFYVKFKDPYYVDNHQEVKGSMKLYFNVAAGFEADHDAEDPKVDILFGSVPIFTGSIEYTKIGVPGSYDYPAAKNGDFAPIVDYDSEDFVPSDIMQWTSFINGRTNHVLFDTGAIPDTGTFTIVDTFNENGKMSMTPLFPTLWGVIDKDLFETAPLKVTPGKGFYGNTIAASAAEDAYFKIYAVDYEALHKRLYDIQNDSTLTSVSPQLLRGIRQYCNIIPDLADTALIKPGEMFGGISDFIDLITSLYGHEDAFENLKNQFVDNDGGKTDNSGRVFDDLIGTEPSCLIKPLDPHSIAISNDGFVIELENSEVKDKLIVLKYMTTKIAPSSTYGNTIDFYTGSTTAPVNPWWKNEYIYIDANFSATIRGKSNAITVSKIDEDGRAIEGAEFTLEIISGTTSIRPIETLTTDIDGYAESQTLGGEYNATDDFILKEVSVPDPYQKLSDNNQLVFQIDPATFIVTVDEDKSSEDFLGAYKMELVGGLENAHLITVINKLKGDDNAQITFTGTKTANRDFNQGDFTFSVYEIDQTEYEAATGTFNPGAKNKVSTGALDASGSSANISFTPINYIAADLGVDNRKIFYYAIVEDALKSSLSNWKGDKRVHYVAVEVTNDGSNLAATIVGTAGLPAGSSVGTVVAEGTDTPFNLYEVELNNSGNGLLTVSEYINKPDEYYYVDWYVESEGDRYYGLCGDYWLHVPDGSYASFKRLQDNTPSAFAASINKEVHSGLTNDEFFELFDVEMPLSEVDKVRTFLAQSAVWLREINQSPRPTWTRVFNELNGNIDNFLDTYPFYEEGDLSQFMTRFDEVYARQYDGVIDPISASYTPTDADKGTITFSRDAAFPANFGGATISWLATRTDVTVKDAGGNNVPNGAKIEDMTGPFAVTYDNNTYGPVEFTIEDASKYLKAGSVKGSMSIASNTAAQDLVFGASSFVNMKLTLSTDGDPASSQMDFRNIFEEPKPAEKIYDAALKKWVSGVYRPDESGGLVDISTDYNTTTGSSGSNLGDLYEKSAPTDPVYVKIEDYVVYTIKVFNQCENILNITQIIDDAPKGLAFIDPDDPGDALLETLHPGYNEGWSDSKSHLTWDGYTEPITLHPENDSDDSDTGTIELIFKVVGGTGVSSDMIITNIAEISGMANEDMNDVKDVDSTPDTNLKNDGSEGDSDNPIKDNVVNEHREDKTDEYYDGSGQDEDDHDIAKISFDEPPEIVIKEYDAALKKWVSGVTRVGQPVSDPNISVAEPQGPSNPVKVMKGDEVTYSIKLFNQCQETFVLKDIHDYLPAGLMFDPAKNPNWSLGANGIVTYNNSANPIKLCPVGQEFQTGLQSEITLTLILTVGNSATSSNLQNWAEIGGIYDESGNNEVEDIDSTPDNNVDNDQVGHPVDDNNVKGDAKNPNNPNMPEDEDDHDPADLTLAEIQIACEVDKDTIQVTSAAYNSRNMSGEYSNVGNEEYRYDVNFRSYSNTAADNYWVDDPLENVRLGQVRVNAMYTPVVWGDIDGLYRIYYRTNKMEDVAFNKVPVAGTSTDGFRPWPNFKDTGYDFKTTERYRIDSSDLALAADEYLTYIRYDYGAVKVGFTSRHLPTKSLNGEHRANDGSVDLPSPDKDKLDILSVASASNVGILSSDGVDALTSDANSLGTLYATSVDRMMAEESNPPMVPLATGIEPGGVVNWTPPNDSTAINYSSDIIDDINASGGDLGLRGITYLVSATKHMENVDIVTSAASFIALGNLRDYDQDAVVTREIVTFEATPDIIDFESIVLQDSFIENALNNGITIRGGNWYAPDGTRLSTGVKRSTPTGSRPTGTGDAMLLSLWIAVLIVALGNVVLILRSNRNSRRKQGYSKGGAK